MPGTRAGHQKARETMIRNMGGLDAYIAHKKRIGAIGGRNGHTGGFAANKELARTAGRKGGLVSRRNKATKVEA